ncbi:hypothetical protein LK337_0995 [Lactococcus lactis subsp. lactis]|nr:hypothetical protein LK337_0995 [Lactococcus lactis subsp. lactis]
MVSFILSNIKITYFEHYKNILALFYITNFQYLLISGAL